jgi:hypothetical protein
VVCGHLFRKKATHAVTPQAIDDTYSRLREMFWGGRSPGQIHSVGWLVGRFDPVPTWEGTLRA